MPCRIRLRRAGLALAFALSIGSVHPVSAQRWVGMVGSSDVVQLAEKSRKVTGVNESLDSVVRKGIPAWLELDRENYRGTVKMMPTREDVKEPIQEQLIVELYSK